MKFLRKAVMKKYVGPTGSRVDVMRVFWEVGKCRISNPIF
jgi:hypothetical protein